MRARTGISLLFILSSLMLQAQVQQCIDVRGNEPDRNAAQGVYDFNNKWTPGSTITVSFLNGSDWQKEKVKAYAPLWCKYANIKFRFLVLGTGNLRISFEKRGSYSYIGTDAKAMAPTRETMNLGWITTNEPENRIRSVILHEFGHALGLLHEHMNPLSNIHWNKPVVYAYYLQYNGWNKEMVDRQVFDRYTVTMTNKKYDPLSIMHYSIPANFTTDGYSVNENVDLSESDKKLIGELYPYNKIFPAGNKSNIWSKLQNLYIDYNAREKGRAGIRITQDFRIYNAKNSNCIMAAYFYNAENSSPLQDNNGINASADGQVAVLANFTPAYNSAAYTNLAIFLPYDELELGTGSFRLKCYVALFDPDLNLITTGGYQYFTFANGVGSR